MVGVTGKMDWAGAHRRDLAKRPNTEKRRISKWADKILTKDASSAPFCKTVNEQTGKPAYRVRKHDTSRGVHIVVGADCLWNTTPGVRQVHTFKNAAAAHAGGFPSVT